MYFFCKFALVKKTIPIFLAFYFLLAALMPNMDLHELGKIPDLVAHYTEHTRSNGDMNFLEFIAFHYGEESHNPSDGHSLPFKDHPCCTFFHTFITPIQPFLLDFTPFYASPEYNDTYTSHFTSLFAISIWQPPQYV